MHSGGQYRSTSCSTFPQKSSRLRLNFCKCVYSTSLVRSIGHDHVVPTLLIISLLKFTLPNSCSSDSYHTTLLMTTNKSNKYLLENNFSFCPPAFRKERASALLTCCLVLYSVTVKCLTQSMSVHRLVVISKFTLCSCCYC